MKIAPMHKSDIDIDIDRYIFSKYVELETSSQAHIFCKPLSTEESGKDEDME